MKLLNRTACLFALLGAACAFAQSPAPPRPAPRPVVPAAAPAPTPPPPSPAATSWVLMDYATGQILVEGNADQRVEPASITKIMTSYVVSAELAHGKIKLDDLVTISENAWRSGGAGTDGSTSFLALNSQVPLHVLLYGMIIQSGNDAAIALAEHAAGSEALFVELMNQHAQRLGMTGTHYVDASGLPNEGLYTTARDVAILSRALIHDYPAEYDIYKIKEFEWNGIKQHNRNTLLWRDASVDGIKTGHTRAAGFCLATSAQRGEQRLIAVVMGAASEKARADANQELLNYGFRFFETHTLYAMTAPLATPELWKGQTPTVRLGVEENVVATVPRGRYGDLKASMNLPSRLVAPLTKGQQVGNLKVEIDGRTLLDRPIVVLDDAPEGGFFKRLSDGVLLWFKSSDSTSTTVPAATEP